MGGGEGLEGLPFKDHWELLPFCVDLSNFSFLLDFIRQNNVWAVPHGYRKPPESIGTCFETTWLYEALGTRFPTSTFQLWVQQLVLETSLFVQASLRRPFDFHKHPSLGPTSIDSDSDSHPCIRMAPSPPHHICSLIHLPREARLYV